MNEIKTIEADIKLAEMAESLYKDFSADIKIY